MRFLLSATAIRAHNADEIEVFLSHLSLRANPKDNVTFLQLRP